MTESRAYIIQLIRKDPVGRSTVRPYEREFERMTLVEVNEFFATHQAELEGLTSFELLASTEAWLRLDLDKRVKEKWKDPVARSFLEAWASAAGVKVGDFRGLLKFRHWFARGRYWPPKLGQPYQPADAFRIASNLLLAIEAAFSS